MAGGVAARIVLFDGVLALNDKARHPPSVGTADTLSDGDLNSALGPAWTLILLCAAVKIVVHLWWHSAYGYFRDELYYLDCAAHLDWGYVDHPPLSIAILAITKAVLGTSLLAIRLPAVLAGAATVALSGLLAWRMGGGRFAQGLASLSILVAPVYLGVGSFFSMNAFDQLFWTLASYALVRAVTTGNARFWLWFGLVAGVGLMNKISVLFLGFGVVVGLLLTRHRRFFATKELWLGGAIAAVIFLPNVLWQIQHGFPTLEFIDNATQHKILGRSVFAYFTGQFVEMHPANAPIWLAGIAYGLFGRNTRPLRILSIAFLAVFALLAYRGVKIYYLSPAFPPVLALGALWIERITAQRRRIRPVIAGTLALLGATVAPIALPWLSPDAYSEYSKAIGIAAPTEEQGQVGAPLPQHLADRFGWEEMTRMVADAYDALDPEDRKRCAILCGNYGEAGAVNFFGAKLDLPRAVSGQNNHFLWGPGEATGEITLVYSNGFSAQRLNALFENVTEIARFEHPFVMPGQNNRTLYLCRGLKKPMAKFWRSLKDFI